MRYSEGTILYVIYKGHAIGTSVENSTGIRRCTSGAYS